MIELLAPVGSREALIAAVESGANAVYLGGKMFGARHYAANFTDEELSAAVRFAHFRGVSVFVTVNTLVDDNEIPVLVNSLQHLYDIGADAIIVQDLGVAVVAKKVAPQLPVHASTQMTVHNIEGVKFLANLGFTRVVLARELSLTEIELICKEVKNEAKKINVEIEIFVHGALCICYSGQCLMSSMIGGRSGNRGRCAQPCRLPYTLVDAQGINLLEHRNAGEYLLSPKDLNTIDLLPHLIETGVTSFKIEGRMKRPEYVAVVVDTYRRAIDSYLSSKEGFSVSEQDKKDVTQIFNRDFTTGYLINKPGRNMISDRRPNNRGVRVGRVISYNPDSGRAVLKLDEPLQVGDIIEFWVKVGGRVNTTVTSLAVKGQSVAEAPAATEVSVSVPTPVRVNDRVFKVYDRRLMDKARAFFTGPAAVRRIPVDIIVAVAQGQPLSIEMQDADGFVGMAKTSFVAEKALKRPLTKEIIAKQVERLGTTIFELRELTCNITGEVMVPVSEINDARRRAVEQLEKTRLARFSREQLRRKEFSLADILPVPVKNALKSNKPDLVVNVDSVEKAAAAATSGADIIMFGGENFTGNVISRNDYLGALDISRDSGKKIIFNTPRIVRFWQMKDLVPELEWLAGLKPDAISVANIGTLYLLNGFSTVLLHGDYPLNIYNSITTRFLAGNGLVSLTLSPELNFAQVEELAGKSNIILECLVHGHMTLMISEYCVAGSYLGELHNDDCQRKCLTGRYWLKDRKNERFPVVSDQYCRMHILNAKELSMLPHIPKLCRSGIGRLRIEAKYMATEEVGRITRLYRELMDLGEDHPLIAKDKADSMEHPNITRGHYFRGVL
ncbi:MAG TPA: U32 family peptidase [Methylomusa anaerophila]|uniref:Putative protease YhbU n=1 Tax=Methylomusa anaerophila TaxID=1930071 RepID=A0A348AP45_9FIRM|nr:U32 family peptidase [Methylomusa anaerophila]BBB92843.1 putative protease YhbU precursor [Methylomusa anaerophila]HML87318.1 U32 family peptidase [Methylomusa anaerophila]